MYGTTYSGRRETSFSVGEERTTCFVIENMLLVVLSESVLKHLVSKRACFWNLYGNCTCGQNEDVWRLKTDPEQAGSV